MELFQTPHDLVQLERQLRLLIDNEFGAADNVHEQDMVNLQFRVRR